MAVHVVFMGHGPTETPPVLMRAAAVGVVVPVVMAGPGAAAVDAVVRAHGGQCVGVVEGSDVGALLDTVAARITVRAVWSGPDVPAAVEAQARAWCEAHRRVAWKVVPAQAPRLTGAWQVQVPSWMDELAAAWPCGGPGSKGTTPP